MVALNTADCLFTQFYVDHGLAKEANPVMAALMRLNPVAFVLFKLMFVNAAILFMWVYLRKWDQKITYWLTLVLSVYVYLVTTHVVGLWRSGVI